MTAGLKPLAAFSDVRDGAKLQSFLSKYFDPLVSSGELVASDIHEPDLSPTLLFALPGETWRLQAYSLMLETAKHGVWNDSLERIEGSLLGYTSEQNDRHLESRRRRGQRWGLQCVYRVVSEIEVSFIRETGGKAFAVTPNVSHRIYLPRYYGEYSKAIHILSDNGGGRVARFFIKIVDFINSLRVLSS